MSQNYGRRRPNEITANRRKKKREGRRFWVIALSAFAILGLIAAFNWKTIVAPLKGIVKKAPVFGSNAAEVGFPVRLPGSSSCSMNSFDEGFMLLTETYVYAYGKDGGQIYGYQHGYSAPTTAMGNSQVLLYDKNGKKFSFFDKSERGYELESEDKILYGAIGEDRVAIVRASDAFYANVLEIFDDKGEWKYTQKFFDEKVMQIAFTPTGKDIIITSVGFNAGDMTAVVRRQDTEKENTDGIWTANLPGNMLPFAVYATGSDVFVLCDEAFFALDADSGEIRGSYEYRGNLLDYDFSERRCALLVDDYSAGDTKAILLDHEAKMVFSGVSDGGTQVEIEKNTVYLLEPSGIVSYDSDKPAPETVPESIPLDEEYSSFVLTGDEILLLGYNTVEKIGEESGQSTETESATASG